MIIDFGDGSRQEWKHAHFDARAPEGFGTHTYSRPGIYTATVTVRDAHGGSMSETRRIQVPPAWQSTAEGDATWTDFAVTLLRGVGRGLGWLAEQLVGLVGEVIAAAFACLLFVSVLTLAAWGLATAPRSTGALLAALAGVTVYGGWRAWRGERTGDRGLLARLAIGWCIFVVAWLGYVLVYCSCG